MRIVLAMVMVSVGPFEARFDPPDRLCEREKNETRKHKQVSSSIVRPAVRPAGENSDSIARTETRFGFSLGLAFRRRWRSRERRAQRRATSITRPRE